VEINLSYCSLGSSSIHSIWRELKEIEAPFQDDDAAPLVDSARTLSLKVISNGNFEMEEIYNALSHGFGFILTVI